MATKWLKIDMYLNLNHQVHSEEMVTYTCDVCQKVFVQKGHYDSHTKRKRPCKKDTALEEIVAKKVKEALDANSNPIVQKPVAADYSKKTRAELIVVCKERGVKGYSNKSRDQIVQLLAEKQQPQQQDTGKFRANTKDQFYTKVEVAQRCVQSILTVLPAVSEYVWVEPSAGNGAFLRHAPATCEKIGLDIEPRGEGIVQQDYMTWTPPPNKKILVFGNPPFGRQSSLAKAFIAKSCVFAMAIAFVLPKSFTKPSMYGAFATDFHLIHSVDLPKDSFVINGEAYDVPCVFQIWERKQHARNVEEKVAPSGFTYVKDSDAWDLAFRRVGVYAGKCYVRSGATYSAQSHNFLQLDGQYKPKIQKIVEKINNHVFPSNTVGPRSLSKSEINVVVNAILQGLSS
jgi:hypothetical protein